MQFDGDEDEDEVKDESMLWGSSVAATTTLGSTNANGELADDGTSNVRNGEKRALFADDPWQRGQEKKGTRGQNGRQKRKERGHERRSGGSTNERGQRDFSVAGADKPSSRLNGAADDAAAAAAAAADADAAGGNSDRGGYLYERDYERSLAEDIDDSYFADNSDLERFPSPGHLMLSPEQSYSKRKGGGLWAKLSGGGRGRKSKGAHDDAAAGDGGRGSAGGAGGTAAGEELPPFSALVCLYVLSFLASIDDAVVLPSLWAYIQDIDGDSGTYGTTMVGYFCGRMASMVVVGRAVDIFNFKPVFVVCLLIGICASLLYTTAPVYIFASGLDGRATAVVTARVFLGCASSVSLAAMSYVATHIPKGRRTGFLGRLMGFQRATLPLGPVFNIGLSAIPPLHVGPLKLTKLNMTGLLTATFNTIGLLLILTAFREPKTRPVSSSSSSSPSSSSLPPSGSAASSSSDDIAGSARNAQPSCVEILRTLKRTGAWMSFVLSFQNNWGNQTLLWTMPIITANMYGMGTVGNSLLFAGGGLFGAVTAFSIGPVTERFKISDRMMILGCQLGVGVILASFVAVFGCHDSHSPSPPVWLLCAIFWCYYIPFIGQMPPNNSIYTKMVGSRGVGAYLSILEVSKTLARACAGYMIGSAYDTLGACALWLLTLGIWLFQFGPLLYVWPRLKLDDSESHYSRLQSNLMDMDELGGARDGGSMEMMTYDANEEDMYF